MDQIQSLNKVNDEIYPSFISMHVPFKNRENLKYLLDSTKNFFDLIATTKTSTVKNKFSVNNINLRNYSYEHCSIE